MVLVVGGAAMLWLAVRWMNARSQPAQTLGVTAGRLASCPDRPNCVSTQAERSEQFAKPIPLRESSGEAVRRLETLVRSWPRARVVTVSDGYLRAEFRSLVCGFVDDVEFWIDESARMIHFRSASRVGYSDLGVNRRRMEEIRRRYGELGSS